MDYSKTDDQSSATGFKPDFSLQDEILEKIRAAAKLTKTKADVLETIPFPVDAFPKPIQEIIKATQRSLNFPVDFTGSAMLTAAGTAIGNTHTAYVMEGWQESPIVYMAIVAPPGSNKSHPLSLAFQPFFKLDDEAYRRYELEKKDYDLIMQVRKQQKGNTELLEEIIEPKLIKTLFSDTTIEALTRLHANNQRGVAIYADELAGFIKNQTRYNSGSETEFWLSSWNSRAVSFDRIHRDSVRLKRPFIPFIGTIQNGVLFQLAKDGKGENGFIDRILFAILWDLKKQPWSEIKLDPIHEYNWEKYIRNLFNLELPLDEWGNPLPRQLKFSTKAWGLLKEWQAFNSVQCNEAETGALNGMYSKLETYAIRLSLILQLLAWACGEADRAGIQSKAVEGAIKLVEYYRKNASIVQRILQNANPLDQCSRKERATYDSLPDRFTTAEGWEIAQANGYIKRTYNNFLKNKSLFEKAEHGVYEKLI